MPHEIRKKKYFKKQNRLVLFACLSVPGVLLVLALLCALLTGGQSGGEAPDLTELLPGIARPERSAGESEEGPPAEPSAGWDAGVTVSVLLNGETVELPLDEYLWGVVAAEMPASFEEEALKAQVIAARTFTLHRMSHPTDNHEADLCGDPGCCQAWISREDRLASWPEGEASALADKLTRAVAETDGLTVCSQGEPIDAVFHSASAARTRSAQEVWGEDVPYLQSVESPEGDEVPNYYSVVTVTPAEFADAMAALGVTLSGEPESWIGQTHYDDGGLSVSVDIGGVEVKTSALRSAFSLRSSTLSVEATAEGITFYVTGYGHGVGMSQYGANALARQGCSAEEILTWYYSGVSVENLADKPSEMG